MANTINAQFDFTGGVTVNNADVAISPVSATNKIGANGFAGIQSLFNTTTPTTALPTKVYCSQQTIAASGNFDLDLNGATMYDTLNIAMAWTKLHFLLVSIVAPNGTKVVRVGPQNLSNANALGFGAVGSTSYLEVRNFLVIENPSLAGFTVDSTHKLVRINNPGADAVVVNIIAIGTP